MLKDKQLEKYADVLLWGLKTARKGRFKKGDIVALRYDPPALRLAEILFEKLIKMGMHPIQRMTMTHRMELSFYENGNLKQLVFHPPGEKELMNSLNGNIYLYAPESLTHLSNIDPKKIAKGTLARKPLREILEKREEKGLFGWTLCLYPTQELADKAGIDINEYEKQVIRACYLDKREPVKEWKSIHSRAMRIKRWLNSLDIEYLHIESRNIDLRIVPGKKRKWVGISGHNIPSFEIFISPDCRYTQGIYYADQPSYRMGNYVEGVRITFKDGKAVKVEAKKGRDFIKKQLSMDRGASMVGEFSLTDKRFSRINRFMANTLYDENYGGRSGNCHLALGASYSDTFDGDTSRLTKKMKKRLGFNDSALHWDIVNTEDKVVRAFLSSGKEIIIYEKGSFKVQ